MQTFLDVLALLLIVTLTGILGRRVRIPAPFLLVGAGLLCGGVFGFPGTRFEPSLFFMLFLPPLLYADGWLTNLREFRTWLRPILTLSIGLVIFTTVVVGYVVHWLVPSIPLSVALALGAIVSPTDAVAVSAILEDLRIPSRLPTIIQGESLVNDATGLVAFKLALAATASGHFALGEATLEFAKVALGGAAIGLAMGFLSSRLRGWLERLGRSDAMLEVTVSLMTPFAAALTAEHLHVSSVIAAVVAGLHNGWADPIRLSSETRHAAWSVWSIVLFLLNGLVFLMLGLEIPRIANELSGEWWAVLLLYAAIVVGLVIVLRLIWVFPGAYIPRWLSPGIRRREANPGWRAVFVLGWSGLRGAVTLAAALSIPQLLPDGNPFPSRSLVIFLATSVILGTLLIQGGTLNWVICRLGIQDDGRQAEEERKARIEINRAGLARLEADPSDPEVAARIAVELEERIEALAGEGEGAVPAGGRRAHERALREQILETQRARALELYKEGAVNDEGFRNIQSDLDLEEARIKGLG